MITVQFSTAKFRRDGKPIWDTVTDRDGAPLRFESEIEARRYAIARFGGLGWRTAGDGAA